jgi:hypothetical protein
MNVRIGHHGMKERIGLRGDEEIEIQQGQELHFECVEFAQRHTANVAEIRIVVI